MRSEQPTDFERIRSDHRSEVAEDYLELIAEFEEENGRCRGSDLARHFSVSHATVTQTLARLEEAGLLEIELTFSALRFSFQTVSLRNLARFSPIDGRF